MGRRGPLPKAASLRLVDGNPGKRPLARSTCATPVGSPDAPDWLQGEARAEWDRIVPPLVAAGMVTPLDRAVLATYCQTWSDWRDAVNLVAEAGITFDNDGMIRKHPAVGIAESSAKLLLTYMQAIGLTPAARARLGAPMPADELSEFERFIASPDKCS